MQTIGVDEAERKMLLASLAAGAPRKAAEPQAGVAGGYGGDLGRRPRSVLHGLMAAAPIALLLWALIAGVLWLLVR